MRIKAPSVKTKTRPATLLYLDSIVPTKKRRISVDVYLPKEIASRNRNEALPVVINLHGSGFLFRYSGEDGPFCQFIADQVGCAVLDVMYSKAPERPFPSADEDIDSVLQWVMEKHHLQSKLKDQAVQLSNDRIALTGFSSGGNLALTTCVRAKESGRLNVIKAVASLYPSTNLAESPYEKPAMKPAEGEAGAVMPPIMRQFLYSCYVPLSQVTPRSSPLISPINASSDCFPQSVTIITCQGDSLAREAQQTALKIQKGRSSSSSSSSNYTEKVKDEIATRGVLHWEAQGQGHAWDKMCKEGSGAAQKRDYAYALVAERLKTALY